MRCCMPILVLLAVIGAGCEGEEYVAGHRLMSTSRAEAYRQQRKAELEAQEEDRKASLRQRSNEADSFETFGGIIRDCHFYDFDLRKEISQKRRAWHLEAHPDLSNPWRQLISEGKIAPGMTVEQSRASWGDPSDIHRTGTTYALHEQWVYSIGEHGLYIDSYRVLGYLYFENGILTSWQD